MCDESPKTVHSTAGRPGSSVCWYRADFVMTARYQQDRHADLGQPVSGLPVPDRADDVELARAVHRVVDGRVRIDVFERLHHLRRPLLKAADVPAVEEVA